MKRFLVIFLLAFLSLFSLNTTAKEEEIESIQLVNGQTVIFLDQESQQISGVKTTKLQYIEFQPEFIAFGKAISIRPLLSIHNQYLSSSAKQASARARYIQAEKSLSRLSNLHKNKAVSTRKLQEQQIQWQSEKTLYNDLLMQTKAIVNASILQWGDVLTQWITGQNADIFNSLINGDKKLLQIMLPTGKISTHLSTMVFIDPAGNRNSAVEASFVGTLPQVDSFSQGLPYLFLTDHLEIKSGMNITAWIPLKDHSQTGVIIPRSSLAWHLGEAFVFIKIDDEHFIHRTIKTPVSVPKGYFISTEIIENEELVVTGTQMLLSHEFRSLIPDEDDD